MRRDTFPHRRRALLALGVLTACATAAATATPAYAGRTTAPASAAARSSAPSPDAPASGRMVAGAVYGAAARSGNGAAIAGFLKLHKSMVAQSHGTSGISPASQPLHNWWGSFPDTNSGGAVMATQTMSSTLRLSHRGDILYAPTMTPADNSCIEVVSVHSIYTPEIWAWDWCNAIAPAARVIVNKTFMKDYTRMVNGRSAYTTKDVRTSKKSNTWTAYLYNYQTKAWDTLFTSSGTDKSGLTFGWDMFEFYSRTNPATGNTYVCGDLASAGTQEESSSIQIRSGSTWTPAGPSNSSWNPSASPDPAAYLCPGIHFNIVANNSDWLVNVTS